MLKKSRTPEPSKTQEEEFEQAPMGGDAKTTRRKVDKEKSNPYHALIQEMRDRADSVLLAEVQKVKTRTFSRTMKKRDGTQQFIDSIISARPVCDPGDGSDNEPAIYVHTYAVRNIGDPRIRYPLLTKDDVGLYVIQIGLPDPITYFIKSGDPALARRLHREIVQASELLQLTDVDAIADRFWKRHAQDTIEQGESLLYAIDYAKLPDPPYESPHEKQYPLT